MHRTLLLFLGITPTLTAACIWTGGSGGSGGSIPLLPDGAYTLTTIQEDPIKCSTSGHTAAVGEIDAAKRTAVITDGVGGIHVTCSVSGTASFGVHGMIDGTTSTGDYFEIAIPDITPTASESTPAAGHIVFSAPWTLHDPYSGACSFYFTPSTPETVATGKVWVTFTCPGVTAGASTCPVKIGYAIFENCVTQQSP